MIASLGNARSPLFRSLVACGVLLLGACSSTRPLARPTQPGQPDAPALDLTRFGPAPKVSATLPAAYLPPPPPSTAEAPVATGRPAQDDDFDDSGTRMPIGFGMVFSPEMALLGGALDFEVDADLTAGPAVQVGIGSDDSLIAPFFQAKYRLPIEADADSALSKLTPFVQAGAGFAYLDKDGRSSDFGVLLNAGAGVRFNTGKSTRLGSTALFNFLPGEVAGDHFYMTWEIVQVAFDF